jgi:hypothetical protein
MKHMQHTTRRSVSERNLKFMILLALYKGKAGASATLVSGSYI